MAEITPGPFIYYPLDEPAGSTSLPDASGNGNDGRINRITADSYEFGREQACGRDTDTGIWLGGKKVAIGSYNVRGMAPSPTGDWNTFTTSIWFRSGNPTAGGFLTILARFREADVGTQDRTMLVGDDGRLYFGVQQVGVTQVVATPAPGSPGYHDYRDAEWHMATATLSSAGMKLYVDGDLVPATYTEQGVLASSVTTARTHATAYWALGNGRSLAEWTGTPSTSNGGWLGNLAKFGVWTEALTDQQIRDLYRSGLELNS